MVDIVIILLAIVLVIVDAHVENVYHNQQIRSYNAWVKRKTPHETPLQRLLNERSYGSYDVE